MNIVNPIMNWFNRRNISTLNQNRQTIHLLEPNPDINGWPNLSSNRLNLTPSFNELSLLEENIDELSETSNPENTTEIFDESNPIVNNSLIENNRIDWNELFITLQMENNLYYATPIIQIIHIHKNLINKRSIQYINIDDDVEKKQTINAEECPICFENVCDSESNCTHTFCKECIVQWSSKTNKCPMCRFPIKTIKTYI
jgi:hypothetical protein